MTRNKKLFTFELISTIFIILLGSLLHFTFKWSDNNLVVGAVSSVNESVWEHLKILFIPALITIIIGNFYLKDETDSYICIKTKGILLALAFIVVFYYTYSGILGTHYPIIDISSFVVAVIIGELYTYKKIKANDNCNNILALITLIILTISFVIFTYSTPKLGIFKDPVSNGYGIRE